MRRILVLLAAALLVGVASFRLTHRARQWLREDLPVLGEVPAFSLVEASGRAFSDADLRGRVWLADFIFTTCHGTCPMLTERLRGLAAQVADPEIRFVSFSVDPGQDTPEVLRRYAREHGAESPRWFFLTGERAVLHGLIGNGFRLAVVEQPSAGERITHSDRIVLVDGKMRIRAYYRGTDTEALPSLLADLERLRSE